MLEKKSDLNIESVHRLGHVAIRVDNVDRAKSFYLRLGMKLVWDDPDWCYLETLPSNDGLALLGPGYKAAGPHFAFHFDDKNEIEQAHKTLIESGYRVGALHAEIKAIVTKCNVNMTTLNITVPLFILSLGQLTSLRNGRRIYHG